ncbi:uncharacterized protein [Antedon mediterranea]|uniref:uncharacterized protein n=1 Tax=Antedon mediterranea TaxID=105859 RepID=UPI003AF87DDB
MKSCPWLTGPDCTVFDIKTDDEFSLVEPDEDKEIRQESQVVVRKNELPGNQLPEKAKKFTCWERFIKAVAFLIHVAQSFKKNNETKCKVGWQYCHFYNWEIKQKAEFIVIRQLQDLFYQQELRGFDRNEQLPNDSKILSLAPTLNKDGLLCVGGRLRKANLPIVVKHPVIIPGKSYIAKLLVRRFHNSIHHQGRQFTEGAVREAGYWVTGLKAVVSSVIHHCVVCRKLRGKLSLQRLADLPEDRIICTPPFTNVGVDCFGPWEVVARKTRGGVAQNKRWAVMFTCLTSRAVHIEVVETMSSSSFINAMRRLIAIRGKVKLFRSDQGSNFIGAIGDDKVQTYLLKNEAEWKLNPPHSSHMGGVWEKMIGVTRKVLDGILYNYKGKSLSHEVLVTFMAEAMAIINSRPLVPLTTDPDEVSYLSPALLLTQKHGCIEEIAVDDNVSNMFQAQWKMVQVLANQFWKQWRIHYLQTLQQRRLWKKEQRNFRVGDIVLLREKNVKRNQWHLGIITQTFTSDDGYVRKVNLQLPSTNS